MFELERGIRDWRTEAERGSSLSVRELDELEDHLRARVDLELELNAALAPAEALAIARHELGAPAALAREFARAGPARWRHLMLAGWAGYAMSFLLPAFGYYSPDGPLVAHGHEIVSALVADAADGLSPAALIAWLPNLIMLLTLPVLRGPLRFRRPWLAVLVVAAGALPLGLGLLRLGDASHMFFTGVGYWVWTGSFVVVGFSLWVRNRDMAATLPKARAVRDV